MKATIKWILEQEKYQERYFKVMNDDEENILNILYDYQNKNEEVEITKIVGDGCDKGSGLWIYIIPTSTMKNKIKETNND